MSELSFSLQLFRGGPASESNLQILASVLLASLLLTAGCGRKSEDKVSGKVVLKPKQAAQQLNEVFSSAAPEIRGQVDNAAKAMLSADYEKAVQSLHQVKSGKNLTLEQGIA